MRLIDADALNIAFQKRKWKDYGGVAYNNNDSLWHLNGIEIEHIIENAPTIEQKTGKWLIVNDSYFTEYKCSICGNFKYGKTPYCPYCGAKIEDDKNK